MTRDTYPIDFQNPVELNRYGYTANNPVNGTDPSGLSFVETGTANRENAEIAKARASYRAGYTPACGNQTVCLELLAAAITAYFVHKIVITTIDAFLPGWSKKSFVIGLGTVLHLHPHDPVDQTKIFAVTDNGNTGVIERAAKMDVDMFFDLLADQLFKLEYAGSARLGRLEVQLIINYDGSDNPFDGWFHANTHKYHAEMLIARWSLEEYGGYPTPYRLLDIVTTNRPCLEFDRRGRPTRWGPNACNNRLPEVRARHPLLFEMTIFDVF
ncbi:hypothetical protein HC928_02015 [bacterium]|nr:hypothetical protein [bacterium]